MIWVRRIVLSIVALMAAPFVGLASYLAWGYFIDNPRYADQYFAGLFPVEEVLASRKWHQGAHPEGGYAYGCSFAIARIDESVPAVPQARHTRDWQMIWGGEWQQTPIDPEFARRNVLERCAHLWPDDLVEELEEIRDTPGSFAARRGFETLYLYAPDRRLAAMVRYGD